MSFWCSAGKGKLKPSYEEHQGKAGKPELVRPPATPSRVEGDQPGLFGTHITSYDKTFSWTEQAALSVLTVQDRACGQLSISGSSTHGDCDDT